MKQKKETGKWLAMLLACVMIFGLVAGCGSSTDDGSTDSAESSQASSETTGETDAADAEEQENITITVAVTAGSTDPADTYMTQYIEEELGITLDWQTYSSEDWSTELSLMLTTDSLPDLVTIFLSDKAAVNEYGQDGYFLNLMDYIDYMPNLQALMEEYPLWAAYMKDENGAIYGLSRLFDSKLSLATGMSTFINMEWLENVGMEKPETLDELYDVLVAFKEQDANGNGDATDEIPLGIQLDTGRGKRFEWMVLTSFGINTIESQMNASFAVDDDGTVYLAQMTEAYKDYLKYMHKLYEEGLMEPSAFTITDDERIEKTSNDIYGVFADYSGLLVALGDLSEEEGNPWEKYEYITALTSDYNDAATYTLGNLGYGSGSVIYVSADTKYPERICELLDHFLSEDSIVLTDYGVEGVTFEYVEDAFGNMAPSYINDYSSSTVGGDTFKVIRSTVEQATVEEADDETLEQMIYEDDSYTYTSQAAIEKELRSVELVYPFPLLTYSGEAADTYSTLNTDIKNIVSSYKAQFVLGQADIDDTWDRFMSDLESAGVEELLAVVQDAYDIFISNQ